MMKNKKIVKYAAYAALAYGAYRTLFTQIDTNGNTAFALFNNGVNLQDIYGMQDASWWATNAALLAGGVALLVYVK